MKRTLLILVLTAIVLFATGCRTHTDMSMKTENDSAQSDNSDLESKDESAQKADAHIDIYQLSIYDYNEYVTFVEKNTLPDFFVTYEDLSEFGEFNGFVCLSDAAAQDYSSLFYSFVDETGDSFCMYVNYTPKCSFAESSKSKPILKNENINPTDMRTATVNESKTASKYVYNDTVYLYSFHGEIMSISWRCGELEYILSDIHDYPATDKETAINKLMNLDSAHQVTSVMKTYPKTTKD